jgi:hypothetical protein
VAAAVAPLAAAALAAATVVMVAAAIASRSAATRGFSRTTTVSLDARHQRQGGHEGQHNNTETTVHGNSP